MFRSEKISTDPAKTVSVPSGSVVYYDQVADTYSSWYQEKTAGGRAMRIRKSRVLELFDKRGGKVLDVGCGPGLMAEEMLTLGCEFWGVDGSINMIEQCHKNFSCSDRMHFSAACATALPFPNDFFDAITCMGVIDRIKEHELALSEMIRVLKKDGTLILAVPNSLGPWAFWRNFIFSPLVALLRPIYYGLLRKPRPAAMGPLARLHRELTYTRLVAALDCKVTDVVYFNFNLLFSPLDEFFPRLAIWVADKAEQLRFGKLKRLGAGFLVKAKKLSNGRSNFSEERGLK